MRLAAVGFAPAQPRAVSGGDGRLRPTVGSVLAAETRRLADAGVESPRLEAELLLAETLAVNRAWLVAHRDDPLAEAVTQTLMAYVRRRLAGEPVAWILGRREFWSLDFEVTRDTLIPRPETELLVELALQRLPANAAAEVADLGTGTGALAVCIARERPLSRVTATDLSEAALAVAARNAARLAPGRVAAAIADGWGGR